MFVRFKPKKLQTCDLSRQRIPDDCAPTVVDIPAEGAHTVSSSSSRLRRLVRLEGRYRSTAITQHTITVVNISAAPALCLYDEYE